MNAHKQYCITYFSTPSTKSHEAYPYFSGEYKNLKIDLNAKKLKEGVVGDDGYWRQAITLDDACSYAKGAKSLFDIEAIKKEYSASDYANLFNCEFIDDHDSVFSAKDLAALTEPKEMWNEYDANKQRPLGNLGVWIGYDPASLQDNASCAVLLPPQTKDGAFKVIETFKWHKESYEYQASKIHELEYKYRIEQICVDKSGAGNGVYETLLNKFPNKVVGITYTNETKSQIINKALDVVRRKRLRFDPEDKDIIRSFLMIRQDLSPSGQLRYSASRTNKGDHGDLAFAVMHALYLEPFAGQNQNQASINFI